MIDNGFLPGEQMIESAQQQQQQQQQ